MLSAKFEVKYNMFLKQFGFKSINQHLMKDESFYNCFVSEKTCEFSSSDFNIFVKTLNIDFYIC